jgi:hypothetical protein
MNPDLRAKVMAHMAAEAAKATAQAEAAKTRLYGTTQVHVTQPPSVYATFTPPQTKTDVPVELMFSAITQPPQTKPGADAWLDVTSSVPLMRRFEALEQLVRAQELKIATLERKLNDQGLTLDDHSEQLGEIIHEQRWSMSMWTGISSKVHKHNTESKSPPGTVTSEPRDEGKHRDSKQRDSTKSSADTMVPCPTCTGLKWPNQKVCKICKGTATKH